MKRQFRQVISWVLTLTLMLTMAVVPVFAEETQTMADGTTEEALKAEINELYASEPGLVGRTHKMQAFIMELALHAKTLNPDFKIIPQDAAELAFIDGDVDNGVLDSLISLVDGWGKEEMLFDGDGNTPTEEQEAYVELVKEGLMVTETSTVETAEDLEDYYARAEHWGIIPYPRIGGELAQELFPGKRWAENGDYFWVEDPDKIGLDSRMDGARDVDKLTDAENYLYNINSRPYDAWDTWDAEEAAVVAEGEDGDRTRIYDSYGNGLLVPSANGEYQPVAGEDGKPADVAKVLNLYGDKWDWWWREAGLDENAGRGTWLNALRNSDYDVIYIDSFYNHRALPNNQTPLTKAEVDSLKVKPDGGRRQVIAYLSIGSAEQNRWYCQDDWVWVDPSNPNTERSMKSGKIIGQKGDLVYSPPENAPAWLALGYGGNYAEEAVVQWWHPEWRDIIINGGGKYKNVATGDNTSSIDRIINQGFDGVYLDNVGVYNRQSKKSGGWNEFENYWLAHGGIPGETSSAPLVSQDLDYTENPVDVPNPDRGFYRANDGMVVPVSGPGSGTMNVGKDPVTVGGAQVTTRVSHVYFDLRNFSSNAFTARGTKYDKKYRAPAEVSIKSRPGDKAPYDYDTHFDYWKANVLPTWPHGTSQPLTEDALAYIRDKLQQVRDGNGVAMVRFSYDGAGYGWVDVDHPEDGYMDRLVADIEPDKATLLGHIEQIAPILHEYEDVIMGVDGGFFGPWGEMHSTTFGTSPEAYAWLLNALLDAVPESRSITVQGGAFLSWYNDTYGTNYTFEDIDQIPAPKQGTPEARFGFFNDSYGYGEDEGDNYPNDWGSLSEGAGWPGDPLGDVDSYDRGRVMTWIRNQNNLYGGEAQGDGTLWNTYPFVAWEASYVQTVYLNADYQEEVHDRWGNFEYTEENVKVKMENAYEEPYKTEYAIFDPVYDGRTGAEYWRDRLGYRLVLREANASEWVAQNGTLRFEGKVQNVGFGNIVNKKNVSVILKFKTDDKSYTAFTGLDARDWRPDLDSRASNTKAYRDLSFSINMGAFGELPVGDYDIYLKINDPKETTANKRSIRFANNGDDIWDADLGANLIGSTTVNPAELSNDDADIAFAKAAIENAAYSATQASVPTEAKALAKINEIIGTLNLRGVRTNISQVSYAAAAAGTSGNRSGTNGSYVFTVELNKGLGTAVVTQELTLTITATSYRSGGSHGGGTTTTTTPPAIVTPVVTPSAIGLPDRMPESARAEIMKQTPWAAESIAELIAIGAIDGTAESFRPRDSITRAEFIKIMVYVLGLEPDHSTASGFGDVNAGSWYLPYVNAAVKAGIINGRDDGTFGADVPISRQDIAAIIYRAAQGIMPAGNAGSFKDADKISPYALEGVGALAEAGIINGMGGGSFAPKNSATRAEAAKMLAGFLKYLKEASD